jgi:excisionase family DNA binding protein
VPTTNGLGAFGFAFTASRRLKYSLKSLGRNRVETAALVPSSLSVQTAARYLYCTPAVVQKLIAEGKLKTSGTGQALRVAKLAIEDYRNAKVLDIKSRPSIRN